MHTHYVYMYKYVYANFVPCYMHIFGFLSFFPTFLADLPYGSIGKLMVHRVYMLGHRHVGFRINIKLLAFPKTQGFRVFSQLGETIVGGVFKYVVIVTPFWGRFAC